MFEITDRLHDLRCRDTGWLRERREQLVREQRRLRVEELAVTRVLDERDALDDAVAASGVSARAARATVETARALEGLPRIAAAAHDGQFSGEQLGAVVQLADHTTDAEWAQRAPRVDPAELARRARCVTTPSTAEGQRRRDARFLRTWWSDDRTMLHLRGALADVEGARFEAMIQQLTEQIRPAKGQPWAPLPQRAADALAALGTPGHCSDSDAGADRHTPRLAARPLLQVLVPLTGPATIAGIPIPDARLEQLRATASVEAVLVDDDTILAVGRRYCALSPKITRAVVSRDAQCRCGLHCGHRHHLEIHHLVPRSWGGTDELSNLVAISAAHHPDLIPHGPWALIGNPNHPDGLRRVRYTDLTADQARRHGLPPPPGPSP